MSCAWYQVPQHPSACKVLVHFAFWEVALLAQAAPFIVTAVRIPWRERTPIHAPLYSPAGGGHSGYWLPPSPTMPVEVRTQFSGKQMLSTGPFLEVGLQGRRTLSFIAFC